MASRRGIVASFRTGATSMIDFSIALFRSRGRGAGFTDRLGNSPPFQVRFMPRLLVRIDRSFRKKIGATAG